MATDPFSLAFIGSFLIGLFILLIVSFTGHSAIHHVGGAGHMHMLHPGGHVGTPSGTTSSGHSTVQMQQGTQLRQNGNFALLGYLNPMSFALFLLGFGFLGYVFHNAMASLALQFTFAIAGVGGVILALIFLILLNRIFGDSEGSTVQDVSDRTGLLGKVSMTIAQNSLGEITYISPGGMCKSIPARSLDGQRLERDQEVVVVNCQNGIAEVDTWEHFVNQEATGIAQGSQVDALVIQQALLETADKNNIAHNMREK
jgi:Na+-transporting methylmalonyl-CoA/oxaloacetate decarboxylase gamma subunit